jgi:hypothetical protein
MDDERKLKMIIVLIELSLTIDFILVHMNATNEVLGTCKTKHWYLKKIKNYFFYSSYLRLPPLEDFTHRSVLDAS